MKTVRGMMVAVAALAMVGGAGAALAQDWKAARAAGTIGEQTDGYLAVVGGNAGLKATVDDINIRRKASYTQTAASQGATVEAMGIAAACTLIKSQGAGEKYRTPGGAWMTVGQGSLQLDPRCPR